MRSGHDGSLSVPTGEGARADIAAYVTRKSPSDEEGAEGHQVARMAQGSLGRPSDH